MRNIKKNADLYSETDALERLSPVFERVCLAKNTFNAFRHRYPLTGMNPKALFPKPSEEILETDLSRAREAYKSLWKNFKDSLAKTAGLKPFSNYLESLISLLEFHFWSVPIRVSEEENDVSLFDHLTSSAALAHTLFKYHNETDSLNEKAIHDRDTKKYIFVNMDLSGIQKYIFDITSDAAKGAVKMLRARSFYLNLLGEGIFRLICSKFGLYSVSRLMGAGGRALILIPNLRGSEKKLKEIQQIADEFCLSCFMGELTVNLSWMTACGKDLEMKNFSCFLGKLNEKSQRAKLGKLSHIIGKKESHVLESFWKDYHPDKGLCPICGKIQASVKVEGNEDSETYRCKACDRLATLGRQVVSCDFLAYGSGPESDEGSFAVPGGYFRLFGTPPANGAWDIVWNISQKRYSVYARKAIANYTPLFHKDDPMNKMLTDSRINTREEIQEVLTGIENCLPKTFYHISLASLREKDDGAGYEGMPFLAIFKADVDNLGFLFGYGLRTLSDTDSNCLTLARYSTFSRMLDRFFTVYLPFLQSDKSEDFRDSYTVFAGGDDLFLIGPWTKTFSMAYRIYEAFRNYTCYNPDITLSGTLNLMKSRYPVNYMARVSEHGLEKAKNESESKDSLHLWNEVMSWSCFPGIEKVKNDLDRLIRDSNSKVSRGFIYDFILLREMKKKFLRENHLRYAVYAALFKYKLGRLNKEKIPSDTEKILLGMYRDCIENEEPLHLGIWWALYLTRRVSTL